MPNANEYSGTVDDPGEGEFISNQLLMNTHRYVIGYDEASFRCRV